MSPSEPTFAVIGGGIVGLSIGWRLAQLGWDVTIFEKSSLGGEASWAGAGMLSPGGEIEAPSRLAALAIESRQLFRGFVRELEETTNLAIDYHERGAIDVAYSTSALEALEQRADRQAELGIASKVVNASDVRTFWPRLRGQDLAGARFYPGDGAVNPRELVTALARACQMLNVSVHQNDPVQAAVVQDEGMYVTALSTTRRFEGAVICAGAWSGCIQVSGVPRLPASEPIKGQLIAYQQPLETCNTIVRHGHTYALQRANGLLLVGASMERVGFDRRILPGTTEWLSSQAAFLFPHLAETSPSETWVGFRPSSDALQLGRWHSDRLYLAYGHFRNGILLAPVTAKYIADEVTASLGMPSRVRV